MILKLLLLIAVIATVYFTFFRKKRVSSSQKRDTKEVSEMVECHKCGLYVELQETLLQDAKYYCSSECANPKA